MDSLLFLLGLYVGPEVEIAGMEIMNQIDLVVANDAEELTRRRGLAATRRTRETERTLLLRKLVRMERQADQLRGWIAQRKADVGASSEMQRMVDWVKAELVGLEEFLDPSRLPSFLTSAARRQHQLHKTRMRNFTHICGASLIDTDWIACSSRMRRVNTATRLGREATIIRSTPCIPRIWKRGAPTIETCIPYSRCSQPR